MHVTKCVIAVERDKELTLTRYLFIFVTEILNKREILEVHGNLAKTYTCSHDPLTVTSNEETFLYDFMLIISIKS